MIALLIGLAAASGLHVVRAGETVESIAADLGDASLAPVLRGDNGLAAGAQPQAGTVLTVPSRDGHVDQEAVILTLSGTVEATVPGRGRLAAAPTLPLPVGSVVCTMADGYLTLRLASDGATTHDDINLLPDTCVRVLAVQSDARGRTSSVEVQSGGVEVRSASADGGDVIVVTGAGVTTGDEGGFRVAVEQTGSARTEALYGDVAVMGAGVEKAVGAGQGSRTQPGEAPSDPVDLLPPGDPTRPEPAGVLLRPDFAWTPVPGALGYRIQIAAAPDFSDIVYGQETPSAELIPDRLVLPFRVTGLWWRVSSFDLTGFEGVPSPARRLALPAGIGQ